MIEPINQNVNINSAARSLKPVEVPHFTGFTKLKSSSSDSFVKAAKEKAPKKGLSKAAGAKDGLKDNFKGGFMGDFKAGASTFFKSAKAGAKEGVDVLSDVAKKGAELTGSIATSLYDDTKGIIRAKGMRTVSTIDGLF